MDHNNPRPLDDVKVVDLTHVLAGPYCTYQLAMLGADVVKIEPLHGDLVRAWGGSVEQMKAGMGNGYVSQNAGKRCMALDLDTPEGVEIVKALAADADVFIENYRPGTNDERGLDAASLQAINQRLIHVSISAFGHTGPEADRPGFDDVVQARSGYMAQNERGDGPLRTGGPVLDYATGMHATSAVMAALLLRNQTGTGQHIDLAMQDVAMLLVNRHTSVVASTGEVPAPAGNRDTPLLGRYRTADGWAMLAGYLPRHKRALLAALGLDHLSELRSRELAERGDEIDAAAEAAMLTRTTAEWDQIFVDAGVVGGGVRDLGEVIDGGQPAGRSLLSEVETSVGTSQVSNVGYLIDGQAFAPRSGVRSIGEDSRSICTEIGYSQADIDRLVEQGVLGVPSA